MRFSRGYSYFKYLSLFISIIQNNSGPSLDDGIVKASRILSETSRTHQIVTRGTERQS